MLFIFKKSKVVLDCFTDRPDVYNYAPISPAIKFLPNWWKNLPRPKMTLLDMEPNLNMRYCPGIIDFYRLGFILPMWSDVKILVGPIKEDGFRWQYADKQSSASSHQNLSNEMQQWGNFLDPTRYQHIKLEPPWFFKTKNLVYWSYCKPTWNFSILDEFIVPNAIDNYYYQHSTTINFFIPKSNETKELIIKFRDPIICITPITEKKVVVKNHLVSSEELNKTVGYRKSNCFYKSYFVFKNLKDSIK